MEDRTLMKRSITVCALALLVGACGGDSARAAEPAPSNPPPASGGETTPPPAQPTTAAAPQHPEVVLERGHITLNHQIQFETNSDVIREAESAAVLNDLIALLRENPQIRRLRVEGHADVRGSAADNQRLSERRARAVAEYLRTHGFASITFEPVGYGKTQPLCSEDTDACHERNRRVEFTIIDPPAQ